MCSQNQARWYKPDLIWLPASNSVLNFQRRHGSYCAKLTQIRSEWPGQSLAKSICSGSKPVCRNHWARFLAGWYQSATSFPLSDLAAFFHRCPRSYCAKPAQIWLNSGWLYQIFAKLIWSRSKWVCKNNLACFWADDPDDSSHILHVYWGAITGNQHHHLNKSFEHHHLNTIIWTSLLTQSLSLGPVFKMFRSVNFTGYSEDHTHDCCAGVLQLLWQWKD